jgi:hypothetical protein
MLDLEEEAYEDACACSGGASTTFQMRPVCKDLLGRGAGGTGAAPVADGANDDIFDFPISSKVNSSKLGCFSFSYSCILQKKI